MYQPLYAQLQPWRAISAYPQRQRAMIRDKNPPVVQPKERKKKNNQKQMVEFMVCLSLINKSMAMWNQTGNYIKAPNCFLFALYYYYLLQGFLALLSDLFVLILGLLQ